MNVYLGGRLVGADTIDPDQHTFIGAFRPPFPPRYDGAEFILCPCGRMLETVEVAHQHWREGHFDVPQYRMIAAEAI